MRQPLRQRSQQHQRSGRETLKAAHGDVQRAQSSDQKDLQG